jgi:hypothetical protein
MRHFHIFLDYAITWHRIVFWFLCIYLFLPVFAWCDHKIVLFWSAEQLYNHIIQNLVKTGINTEINKQSNVKFWLHWIKYGAVSYSLSCKKDFIFPPFKFDQKCAVMCKKSFFLTLTKIKNCLSLFTRNILQKSLSASSNN